MGRTQNFRQGSGDGGNGDDDDDGWGGGLFSDIGRIAIGVGRTARSTAADVLHITNPTNPVYGQWEQSTGQSPINSTTRVADAVPIFAEGAARLGYMAVTNPAQAWNTVTTAADLGWEAFKADPLAIPREYIENIKENPEDLVMDAALTAMTGGGFAALRAGAARLTGRAAAREAAAVGTRAATRQAGRVVAREAASELAQEAGEEVGRTAARQAATAVGREAAEGPGWRNFLANRAPAGAADDFLESGIKGPISRMWERTSGVPYSPWQRARMSMANAAVRGDYESPFRRLAANMIAGPNVRGVGNPSLWRARRVLDLHARYAGAAEVGEAALNPVGYAVKHGAEFAEEHPELAAKAAEQVAQRVSMPNMDKLLGENEHPYLNAITAETPSYSVGGGPVGGTPVSLGVSGRQRRAKPAYGPMGEGRTAAFEVSSPTTSSEMYQASPPRYQRQQSRFSQMYSGASA